MNIWIVAESFSESGAIRRRFAGFMAEWKTAGYSPTVFTKKGEGEGVCSFSPIELGGLALPQFILQFIKHGFKTKAEDAPHVVIATGAHSHLMASWLVALRHKATLVVDLSAVVQLSGLCKFICLRAEAVVSPSATMANQLTQMGVPAEKVFTLPSGVGAQAFEGALSPQVGSGSDKVRNELQISNLMKVVLFYGHFEKSYALGQIVDVARKLITRSDVIFLMVGEGDDAERLGRLAAGMPNIKFIPFPPSAMRWDYLNAAQICLVTGSSRLPAPLHTPEFMFDMLTTANPIICSMPGEATAIMEESDAALCVPAESPERLAKAILSLIDSPDRAKQMGQNGRMFIKSKYTYPVLAQQYANLFNPKNKGETE